MNTGVTVESNDANSNEKMSTLAVELHPQAHNVKCTDVAIFVDLLDGRTISAPLVWFPKLSQATKEQLDNWELLGDGRHSLA